MSKLVAYLIAGALIFGLWLVYSPGPDESPNGQSASTYPMDRAPAANNEQRKETAVRVRLASKDEAPQTQLSSPEKKAAFLAFLISLYRTK
jgi:hypothetical protein